MAKVAASDPTNARAAGVKARLSALASLSAFDV
jgi:hypothetical protein